MKNIRKMIIPINNDFVTAKKVVAEKTIEGLLEVRLPTYHNLLNGTEVYLGNITEKLNSLEMGVENISMKISNDMHEYKEGTIILPKNIEEIRSGYKTLNDDYLELIKEIESPSYKMKKKVWYGIGTALMFVPIIPGIVVLSATYASDLTKKRKLKKLEENLTEFKKEYDPKLII